MEISGVKNSIEGLPIKSSEPVKIQESVQAETLKSAEQKISASQSEQPQKNEDKVQEAVDKLNKTAVIFDRSLRFQVHDKTHRTMVSVVDMANEKVIRQIPSEEVLDLVAKMDDYLGLIFDKKA